MTHEELIDHATTWKWTQISDLSLDYNRTVGLGRNGLWTARLNFPARKTLIYIIASYIKDKYS